MAVDFYPVAQYHFIADHGKRADTATRSDLGIWTNDRGGMDLH
jgi:hypothetical protein